MNSPTEYEKQPGRSITDSQSEDPTSSNHFRDLFSLALWTLVTLLSVTMAFVHLSLGPLFAMIALILFKREASRRFLSWLLVLSALALLPLII